MVFLQLGKPVKIEEEQDRSDDPCQRIAENNGLNRRTERYCSPDPDDTECTDAQTGDNHRNPAVADASQGTGINLDADVGEEGRNQILQDLGSFFDNRRVRGKQQIDIAAAAVEQDA